MPSAGMGFAQQNQPRVAIGVVGDGATSQGDFLEALNFAGIFNAQAILFVQNNHWAISVPARARPPARPWPKKASAMGYLACWSMATTRLRCMPSAIGQ